VPQRRDQFLSSWQEFAPDVPFAGFTLAQFKEESTKPLDVRKEMVDAKTQVKGLKRNQAALQNGNKGVAGPQGPAAFPLALQQITSAPASEFPGGFKPNAEIHPQKIPIDDPDLALLAPGKSDL
jgi:hypothetical protein